MFKDYVNTWLKIKEEARGFFRDTTIEQFQLQLYVYSRQIDYYYYFLCHRDIKPENILVTFGKEGRARMITNSEENKYTSYSNGNKRKA